MATDNLNSLRLQLLANGYHPIPTYGKIARIKGWQTRDFLDREMNAKRIASWPRRYPDLQSTGARLDNGLVVIDGDASDPELSDAIYMAVEAHAPHIARAAPMRYGKGDCKFALFARWGGTDAERFNRQASRYYCRPEELAAWQAAVAAAATGERVPDPETHKVEIFGGLPGQNGNSSRHFGVYGPHSYNEDGSVAAEYRWLDGGGLLKTPLGELPVLLPGQANLILDAFDTAAAGLGWVALAEAAAGHASVAYDITGSTRFDTNKGGEQIDYEELCADYALHGGTLRCSANFMPGRGDGGKRDHCSIGDNNRHGCVAVYVHGDAVTHFPAEFAPRPDLVADEIERLREELGPALERKTDDVSRPPPGASLARQALWLIGNYGYLAAEDAVVELNRTGDDCRVKPVAFGRLYRSWREEVTGPRGGRTWAYATGYWEVDPARVDIAGVRMAPDMAFPLYEEGGRRWKNTYRRPVHEGLDRPLKQVELIVPFVEFMERFVPDPIEREWLLDWMAHKWLHPEVPGTSIFFVADDEASTDKGTFGTGRGLMSRIVRKLYGEQYCRAQSFGMLDGTSSQAQFNDWMHGSVLVTVDEARTSKTAYRRGERNAAYEVLKDLVDPAPKLHRFNGKNRQAFDGMSYCSVWAFTNHGDALSIPEHDRRFTILRNGLPIGREEAKAIVAWMETPGAIASLAASLAARDLTGFDMYVPLETAGKADMAEQSISDVEDALRDIMADPDRGLVFTKRHIEMLLEHNYSGQSSYWRGEFQGLWSQYCVTLKGDSGAPRVTRVFGTRKKLFCFRHQLGHVRKMPEAAIKRQVTKWGGVTQDAGDIREAGDRQKDE